MPLRWNLRHLRHLQAKCDGAMTHICVHLCDLWSAMDATSSRSLRLCGSTPLQLAQHLDRFRCLDPLVEDDPVVGG